MDFFLGSQKQILVLFEKKNPIFELLLWKISSEKSITMSNNRLR